MSGDAMNDAADDERAVDLNSEERELIRSLILADPDLVLDDDQVMRALLGDEGRGDRKIVDLRDKLVERLEVRLQQLVQANRSVIAAAYENVASTEQIHRAVLSLSEPRELSEFLRRLTRDVPPMVGVDETRLCLETDIDYAAPAEGLGDGLADRVMALPEGTVDAYLLLDGEAPPRGVILRPAGEEAELIFGDARVRSEALMRLDLANGVGMLAFGSRDAERFGPDQGVDLLSFFGGVVARLLRQRLADAEGTVP